MATVQDFVADLVAAVQPWPGLLVRLGSDYREDLEPIPAGGTRYQVQAQLAGGDSDSNVTRQAVSLTFVVLRKLPNALDERGYTEGDLQTYLADLSRLNWWRALTSVYGVLELPTVETTRVGNVVRLEVEIRLALRA